MISYLKGEIDIDLVNLKTNFFSWDQTTNSNIKHHCKTPRKPSANKKIRSTEIFRFLLFLRMHLRNMASHSLSKPTLSTEMLLNQHLLLFQKSVTNIRLLKIKKWSVKKTLRDQMSTLSKSMLGDKSWRMLSSRHSLSKEESFLREKDLHRPILSKRSILFL